MRDSLALLISALFHLSMIWFWPYHAQPINIKRSDPAFRVDLHSSSKDNLFSIQEKVSISLKPLSAIPSIKSESSKNFSSKALPENKLSNISGYFPTVELDRKALPISNINISNFENVFLSGFPVKLRLYINAEGKVVNIVRNNISQPDQDMVARLENILYEMTFIPARKNGMDVGSYQDVEFSF